MNWLLLLAGLLGTLAILLGLWIYLRRGKLTREKFAFRIFLSMTGLAAMTILPLLAGDSVTVLLELAVKEIFGVTVVLGAGLTDKILSIVVLIALIYLGVTLHRNWEGPTTERSHNLLSRGLHPTLLEDVKAELQALRAREPLKIHEEASEEEPALHVAISDVFDWKTRAARLLMAYEPQYQIDLDSGWHETERCFVGTYGSSAVAVVHCPSRAPSAAQLQAAVSLASSIGLAPTYYVLITPGGDECVTAIPENFPPRIYKFSEEMLLERIASFDSYFEYLRKMFEINALDPDGQYVLSDTYVESSGSFLDGTRIASVERHLREWMEDESTTNFAVLGEYGQGKSTLANRLAYEVLRSGNVRRTPIVVELRGKSPRNDTLEEMLFSWCRRFGVSTDALLALHHAGRLVIILEGFDEIDLVGDAEVRIAHFRSLWRFAHGPAAKVIITGRPNFFFDTREMERGLLLKGSSPIECRAIRLSLFDAAQVEQAVRAFPEDVKRSLVALVTSPQCPEQLRDLLSRPSTLFWAASRWKELEASEDARIVSSSVIAAFLGAAQRRQGAKNLQTPLSPDEREYFLYAIARRMHRDNPGANQISATELQAVVAANIESIPDRLLDFAAASEPQRLPLRERYSDPARRLQTCLTDVRSSGVLVEDVSRAQHFKFAHKAFYEYLVATQFAYAWAFRDPELRHAAQGASTAAVSTAVLMVTEPEFPLGRSEEVIQFSGEILAGLVLDLRRDWSSRTELAYRIFCAICTSSVTRAILISSFRSRILRLYLTVGLRTQIARGVISFPLLSWYKACLSCGITDREMAMVLPIKAVIAFSGDTTEDPEVRSIRRMLQI